MTSAPSGRVFFPCGCSTDMIRVVPSPWFWPPWRCAPGQGSGDFGGLGCWRFHEDFIMDGADDHRASPIQGLREHSQGPLDNISRASLDWSVVQCRNPRRLGPLASAPTQGPTLHHRHGLADLLLPLRYPDIGFEETPMEASCLFKRQGHSITLLVIGPQALSPHGI